MLDADETWTSSDYFPDNDRVTASEVRGVLKEEYPNLTRSVIEIWRDNLDNHCAEGEILFRAITQMEKALGAKFEDCVFYFEYRPDRMEYAIGLEYGDKVTNHRVNDSGDMLIVLEDLKVFHKIYGKRS